MVISRGAHLSDGAVCLYVFVDIHTYIHCIQAHTKRTSLAHEMFVYARTAIIKSINFYYNNNNFEMCARELTFCKRQFPYRSKYQWCATKSIRVARAF